MARQIPGYRPIEREALPRGRPLPQEEGGKHRNVPTGYMKSMSAAARPLSNMMRR